MSQWNTPVQLIYGNFEKGTSHVMMKDVSVKQLGNAEPNETLRKQTF
jgi:hypothetical protein